MSQDKREARARELRDGAQRLLGLDYFAMLGVSRNPSPDELKNAFLDAVKTWHPDRVPEGMDDVRPLVTKVFARLELARATLGDPARRLEYIQTLTKPATSRDLSAAEAGLEAKKAEAFLKKNDIAAAEHHLRRAAELAPDNGDYRAQLVSIQAKPDAPPSKLRELVAELDRVLSADAKCERAYFVRAQLRKRIGLTEEAAADFARAASINPKNLDAVREVRIHKMRQERASAAEAAKVSTAKEDGVVAGFIKKLWKR